MNKNTLLAFVLIMLTVLFFNSEIWNRFYHERIMNQPYVVENTEEKENAQQSVKGEREVSENAVKTEKVTEESKAQTEPEEVQFEKDTIVVETDRFIATISSEGGRIISLLMKEYTQDGEMIEIVPEDGVGGAQLSINNKSYNETIFNIVDEQESYVFVGEDPYVLVMETTQDGEAIRKIFTFSNESYKIGYDVEGDNLSGSKVGIGWLGGINEPEASNGGIGAPAEQRRVHYYNGNTVQHMRMSREGTEESSGRYKWIGTTSKYFFINLISDSVRDMDVTINAFETERRDANNNKIEEINYSLKLNTFAESNRLSNFIYAGPTDYRELRSHESNYEKVLFPVLGWTRHILWADSWFPPLAEFVLRVLLFLQGIVKDYGIAILILTLLMRLATYPLTHSSTKSMNRMREVQPKINALRQKYKSNPQKMNTELMALYKAEGINPLNPGCLPMFLQMPIFISLFVVLRKAIELRGAGTVLFPWISDLSQPETLISLPFSLPVYGASIALLPILMGVLTYFQNKMTIKDPNQKMMIYIMPIFMLVLFNNFPAGLVLYWTTSSGLQLLQQFITRSKGKYVASSVPVKTNKDKRKTVKR
ncbi:Inner membrane protein translocase component YidC, long form [Chitinispirillum alkaliphilum]|nr:Inner membrane protein translocase component YidC, long form [Chitinispirillum alkaliphilum]